MATTIGRAGKQVFAAMVSPTNGQQPAPTVSTPSSTPKPLLSQTLPTSSSSKLLSTPVADPPISNAQKLQSFRFKESNSLSRLDTYSNDWTDLEKTLQECMNLETHEELSPKIPLHLQGSSNSRGNLSPSNRPPKLGDGTNRAISQSLNSNGYSSLNHQGSLHSVLSPQLSPKVETHAFSGLSSSNLNPAEVNDVSTATTAPIVAHRASYDKEQLLAQLEHLKQQNALLTDQIEATRIESQTQLEYERHQKLLTIANLEKENQQLLQQLMTEKLRSEQQLEKEKHLFIQSIRKMEEDKKQLETKLYELEDSKSTEIGLYVMEKLTMEKQLAELERKQALTLQQIQNHSPPNNSPNLNTGEREFSSADLLAAASLDPDQQEQQDNLLNQLQAMEQEKQQLMALIQENLSKSQQENSKLTEEIESMKNAVNSKLLQMEQEKLQLAEKLKQAEDNVNIQTNLIQQQIEKQKQQTAEMVEALEHEKQQLILQQQQIQQQKQTPAPLTTTPSSHIPTENEQTNNNGNGQANKIDILVQEKTILQEKLKASAEQSKQKVRELSEVIQKRKRKLLMKNMGKIKQNMSNEKLKEQLPANDSSSGNDQIQSAISSVAAVLSSPPAPSGALPKTKSLLSPDGGFMKSNRSLFDRMTEVNKLTPKTGSKGELLFPSSPPGIAATATAMVEEQYEIIGNHNSNYTNNNWQLGQRHVIDRIDEKTFMDADSSDEGEGEEDGDALTRKQFSLKNKKKLKKQKTKKEFDGSSDEEVDENDEETSSKKKSKKRSKDNEESANSNNNQEAEQFSDLPAPHAAAASGDLNRLQMICSLDMALLESLDSVGRQPLFYAAAHGRENIIDYILTNSVNAFRMLSHADSFGDSPLHAASAGGSVACIEKILTFHQQKVEENPYIYQELSMTSDNNNETHDYTHSYVNIKNSTGMTSIHLSGNGQCIEKLIEFGGDINLTDIHLRTPLFIGCAINKESCVEYLIGYLDHSEDALLTKDYRGDTPLHAAACNGSVECLLLLLQCGIDPRICNDQGLKAIDLAIRNKHYKCKEILAEYHLHYCTSSEFDSVLFLAMLEVRKEMN